MRLMLTVFLAATAMTLYGGDVISPGAAELNKLRSEVAEMLARDRKGEPADVILEKALTGDKKKVRKEAAAPSETSEAVAPPSRLELWRRNRPAQSRSEKEAKTSKSEAYSIIPDKGENPK